MSSTRRLEVVPARLDVVLPALRVRLAPELVDTVGADRGPTTATAPTISMPLPSAVMPVADPESLVGRLPGAVPASGVLVVQTSGSTGSPKRVLLSARALLSSARESAALLGSGQWLLALPLSYIAGIQVAVRSILARTIPVQIAEGSFTAERFAAAARRMDAGVEHYTAVVPTQLDRLVAAGERDAVFAALVRGFCAILVGGQRMPHELRERAQRLGYRVVATYGSTETSGGCVYDGTTFGSVDVKTVDGRVRLGGPTLAEGYVDDSGGLMQHHGGEGFDQIDGRRMYTTADVGELVDGVLTVRGRADNTIITGGLKVNLDEVEALLPEIPGLFNAVAVPVQNKAWGESYVVVGDGRSRMVRPTLQQVSAHVTASLGAHASPSWLGFLETGIPLLASGKPDRVSVASLVTKTLPE